MPLNIHRPPLISEAEACIRNWQIHKSAGSVQFISFKASPNACYPINSPLPRPIGYHPPVGGVDTRHAWAFPVALSRVFFILAISEWWIKHETLIWLSIWQTLSVFAKL